MRQNSKKFKSHARANSFARELIESGKLDVQIWGLPEPDG